MELSFSVRTNDRYACGERPLCHCLNVSESEVRTVVEQHELVTVRAIAQTCGAGGGCTACHRHLKRILNEHAVAKRVQQMPMAGCQD